MKSLLNEFKKILQEIKEEWISMQQSSQSRHVIVERLGNPFEEYNRRLAPSRRLRFSQEEDLDRIVALEKLGYDGFAAWHYHDFRQDFQGNPYGVYILLEEKQANQTWELIGLIIGRFRARGSHISHIIVHPDLQGQGFGDMLLSLWISCSQQLDMPQITLEVRESNHIAQSLYRKYDFEMTGRRKNYYEDNQEAAIVMRCKLLDD